MTLSSWTIVALKWAFWTSGRNDAPRSGGYTWPRSPIRGCGLLDSERMVPRLETGANRVGESDRVPGASLAAGRGEPHRAA